MKANCARSRRNVFPSDRAIRAAIPPLCPRSLAFSHGDIMLGIPIHPLPGRPPALESCRRVLRVNREERIHLSGSLIASSSRVCDNPDTVRRKNRIKPRDIRSLSLLMSVIGPDKLR